MSSSHEIEARIKEYGDWRGKKLLQLRAFIKRADPAVVEEIKWRKPSNPGGVPVWSHDGIVCIGEALKTAVRLTFPKGASIKDPSKLFNARLDSGSVRAIDFSRAGCHRRGRGESADSRRRKAECGQETIGLMTTRFASALDTIERTTILRLPRERSEETALAPGMPG